MASKKMDPTPEATPTMGVPDKPHDDDACEEGALLATGLEDYGYWYRWKLTLPPQPAGGGPHFQRGLIWH